MGFWSGLASHIRVETPSPARIRRKRLARLLPLPHPRRLPAPGAGPRQRRPSGPVRGRSDYSQAASTSPP